MLGLMLHCCCLDILNNFLTRDLYFYFAFVPTNMDLVLPKGISTEAGKVLCPLFWLHSFMSLLCHCTQLHFPVVLSFWTSGIKGKRGII